MKLIGEKIVWKPHTLERCHEFYKNYISDAAITIRN